MRDARWTFVKTVATVTEHYDVKGMAVRLSTNTTDSTLASGIESKHYAYIINNTKVKTFKAVTTAQHSKFK